MNYFRKKYFQYFILIFQGKKMFVCDFNLKPDFFKLFRKKKKVITRKS